jgi:hypothetical protein
MTTGSWLYLLMSIGAFAAFSAVLAYESWQQDRLAAETGPNPADQQDTGRSMTA